MFRSLLRDIRDTVRWSLDKKMVELCTVAIPSVLIVAFLLFPVAERWNLGYDMFDLACIGSTQIAFGGLMLIVLQWWLHQVRIPIWPAIFLILEGIVAALAPIGGRFYWAMGRGFFLN